MSFPLCLPAGQPLLTVTRPSSSLWVLELHNGADNRLTHTLINEGLKPALDAVEKDWREQRSKARANAATTKDPLAGAGALVIVGKKDQDKFFSNGLDFANSSKDIHFFKKTANPMLTRLLTFPIPTVAAINGHCFAAGMMLALACDYRVMTDGSQRRVWMSMNEIHFGAPWPLSFAGFLRAKVGDGRLHRKIALEGHRFTPKEALETGLVDHLVQGDTAAVLAKAQEVALSAAPFAKEGVWGLIKVNVYHDALSAAERVDPLVEAATKARLGVSISCRVRSLSLFTSTIENTRRHFQMSLQWKARMISPDEVDQAPLLRTHFTLAQDHRNVRRATLHVTALGIVEPFIDGRHMSEDVLCPGWSSYEWRLRYSSYNVTTSLTSNTQHVLGLAIGNGWARGRLTWSGGSAFYTKMLGALAQLEIEYADGGRQDVVTNEDWQAHSSAVLADDLYDGQTVDARLLNIRWATLDGFGSTEDWTGVHCLEFDTALLTKHLGPPVRRQEVLPARKVWESPSGKVLVDFRQNLVGWLRFRVRGKAGHTIAIRHAEVLENDELGTRPLRTAHATDRFILSGELDFFEPTFTFHGFRYAEVTDWPGKLKVEDIEAVVVHSQLERTGTFECSNEMLNQLHNNVVWSLKGNFLDVPTDCPQRDERLGWTGDLAVFGPTAAFLFDVSDFLRDWLRDLEAEQAHSKGLIPFVVPDVLKYLPPIDEFGVQDTTAIWSDVAVWLPWALWRAYGDTEALEEAYPATTAHMRRVESKLSSTGLWDSGFQFGDWLDPDAPPDDAAAAKADRYVVATSCAFRSAETVAKIANTLGHASDAQHFSGLAQRIRAAFHKHYIFEDGKIKSDCTTVYSLAIVFGIVTEDLRQKAGDRLAQLVEQARWRVSTGFAGTPYINDALTLTGHLDAAYRLILESECPSWLYPVTMGATTIWERWDSMRPDGSINPGQMTSFNHYALGAVADWMHRTILGISVLEPGYARVLIFPQPGGGITWARGSMKTQQGILKVDWHLEQGNINIEVTVPAGITVVVHILGLTDRECGEGHHVVNGQAN